MHICNIRPQGKSQCNNTGEGLIPRLSQKSSAKWCRSDRSREISHAFSHVELLPTVELIHLIMG